MEKWTELQNVGKFVRQKCYLEEFDDGIHIICAGMPKTCYKYVNWDDFKVGFSCEGKLTFKNVKGGVILVDTDFTIKPEKSMFKKDNKWYNLIKKEWEICQCWMSFIMI